MGLIKTIKYVKAINDIADKVDKIKKEKIDDILTAIYKINIAVCYLESIIVKAKDVLGKLVLKLNEGHPMPTPAEEALTPTEDKDRD